MYHYTDEDKRQIKRNPINRFNATHVVEIVRYAQMELHQANGLPHASDKQAEEKKQRIAEATATLNERLNKLNLYKELYPELF